MVVAVFAWFMLELFGVGTGDMLLYAGYELAFCLIPGALAYMALTGRGSVGVRGVAVGWALGYAIELAMFALTAQLDVRGAFSFYPLLVVALTLPVVLRRRRGEPLDRAAALDPARHWPWGLAVILLVLIGYLGQAYFVLTPLPWAGVPVYSIYQDYVWQMSAAAEALHHWPLQIPNAAGETLHYHYFAYMHMAAVSQVTGIEIALVNLRLYELPLVLVTTLQLIVLGRMLSGGNSWAGVGAAGIALILGPFTPFPRPPSEFFTHIFQSASYGFGLVLFLAAVIEICALIESPLPWRKSVGRWVVVALLLAACGGAKSSILPVVGGGLALVFLWALRYSRAALVNIAVAAGITAFLALVYRYTLYAGTRGLLTWAPFAQVKNLQPYTYFHTQVGTFVGHVLLLISAAIQIIKALLPLLLGLWAYLAFGRRRSAAGAWLLCLLAVSTAVFVLVTTPGGSEVYFWYYGYVAAAGAAGAGVYTLWQRRIGPVEGRPVLALIAVGLLLATFVFEGPMGARAGEPLRSRIWSRWTGPVPPGDNPDVPANYLEHANLTPDLYTGLRWIRAHTPTDAVIAANNRWEDSALTDARYYYYSALAERRMLLEGDQGTNEAGQGHFLTFAAAQADPSAGPYADRVQLINRIFQGDRAAMVEAAQRYHVRYLLLDKVHSSGTNIAAMKQVAKTVYENPALAVFEAPTA